jgi:VWFA-related protein
MLPSSSTLPRATPAARSLPSSPLLLLPARGPRAARRFSTLILPVTLAAIVLVSPASAGEEPAAPPAAVAASPAEPPAPTPAAEPPAPASGTPAEVTAVPAEPGEVVQSAAEVVPGDAGEPALFFETLDVNVINVDVYVTDKDGKAVTGLKREDFEILENKKPVKITNFYAVESGFSRDEKGNVETAPSPIPGMPPVPVVPEDQRLRLVVYVDNFNIRPFNRNRVFRQLRDFLRREVGPQDRVMLVSYDRELHVRHGFTSDPALINSALFDLEKLTGWGVQADSERRDILRELEDAEESYRIEGRVRQYAQSLENDLTFTIGALKEMVGSLAGLPGRKALLYVSDGLEMRPAEDMFIRIQEKFRDARVGLEVFNYDMTRRFQELAASANANRISFYTLEATGLRISTTISAENQGMESSPIADATLFQNLQAPLRYLAESTGGQAIVNTNDPTRGLQKIAQDFDNYYSLGYTPAHSGDGRYYRIEVRVKGRKGLTVRHRDGYRDKSVESKMSDATLATLYFGYEDNPLELTSELVRSERRSDGHYNVSFAVRFPIGKLTLVPQGEALEARVRLFVGAMDDEGRKSDVQQIPLTLRIPSAEVDLARKQSYVYEITLVMREGAQKLALGLRDEISATASFISRHLDVGRRSR